MKKKINIGFDIGTTSVGWCIVDEQYKILDLGVRLFPDPADPKDGKLKNESRRSHRSSRRRIWRARNRKNKFKEFILSNKILPNEDIYFKAIDIDITKYGVDNPIELKVKAMNEKVTIEELVFILFHYLHHRGFFYVTDDMLNNIEKYNLNLSDDTLNNINLSEFPSSRILDFYKKNEYYKGAEINSQISAKEWIKEITYILKKQGWDDKLRDQYIEIFSHIRDFATGPGIGDKNNPSPWTIFEQDSNGNIVKKYNNMWEKNIGKCSIYPNEYRGGKKSPIAEMFNFLNELSNIKFFDSYKLTSKQKEKLFNELFSGLNKKEKPTASKLTLKTLINLFKNDYDEYTLDENQIAGYISKDDKAKFEELNNYIAIVKYIIKNNLIASEYSFNNLEYLKLANQIFVDISKENDNAKRLEILKKYSNNEENNLALLKVLKSLTQTHSLSYKAMQEYINHSLANLDQNLNQMQFFFDKIEEKNNFSKNTKYLPSNLFDDAVISPTVRRAFNQTVNVMNKIIKFYSKYYQINSVNFELPRDKNSKEERKSIDDLNKKNAKMLSDVNKENGSSLFDEEKLSATNKLKIKLWKDQNYVDIYDGQPLSYEDIVSKNLCDIDHIIPFSISNDDSFNNKVITKRKLNALKNNRTPYQWLTSSSQTNWNFESFKECVIKNITNKNKIKNLLYLSDPYNDLSFIGRNLSDTRYASRLVMNTFQDFFKQKENIYGNVRVNSIRGAMTNYARYNLFVNDDKISLIPKNRDIYLHHAIDAAIVCYLGMNKNIVNKLQLWKYIIDSNKTSIIRDSETKRIIDAETGEIIDLNFDLNKENQNTYFGSQLAKYNDINCNKVKFSRTLNRRTNIQLSDETIYSIKWIGDKDNSNRFHIITKLDIVENTTNKLDSYFWDEYKKEGKKENKLQDYERLLIFRDDKQLYNNLKSIYNRYRGNTKENPFVTYMKIEHNVENPKYIKVFNQKIKKLRLVKEEKTTENTLILKKHNKNAVLSSLSAKEIRIYKDKNEKLIAIPINAKVLKWSDDVRKIVIDNEKLDKVLQKNNIKNINFISINEGTLFLDKETKKLFYSNGGGNLNHQKLELKPLFATNETIKWNSQKQISLSTIIKDYYLCDSDELGNLYNIREINL